ncbi:P-loop containing nucleoside triphosphate hydrolase protein [Hypoxylon sp. FL1150]|nr:P-loop containing nucleoside triphosphate hydrolase protein [Hypoxylon sp. FL1150]
MLGEEEIVRHPEGPPAFHSATFRRAQQQDSFRMQLEGKFVVGGLDVIAGVSGSGKSNLLLSLLEETILEEGSATCPRDELDRKRYDRVIDVCGLRPDLEKFDCKDLTNVGVNGANLSGGQRQRFSAIDSVTQKHVWERCFHEDVLQGRTVILVTQMQAARDAAELMLELAFFAISFWLSVWVGASSSENGKTVGFYVDIYGAWLLSFSTISAMSQAYLQLSARKAVHALHEKLVTAASSTAPPATHTHSTLCSSSTSASPLTTFSASACVMPTFVLPAALICSVGIVCAEMYTRCQLFVKALTSASQSPIYLFFGESMTEKAVIRACAGLQEAFADEFARRLRVYARAGETQYNLNRWICVRADGCAAVIALFTGVIAISMGSNALAGRLGFSLTSAIGLGQTILTMYASLPLETDAAKDQEQPETPTLPEPWPSQGKLEFRRVTAKYALDGPDILQDLSLTINSGERVAVFYRTGSGKSTSALSVVGFTNVTEGSVLVDMVDISTIPLRVLRRRLTIIPQEPVLFGSDVRFKLDPSQTAPDEHLTEAIYACSAVESLGAPRIREGATSEKQRINSSAVALSLYTPVSPRGSNFPAGQRQVLSLARATVQRSKIVVLDEATASLDHVSDAAIQQVLRSAFRGKTIFAIVHRLSTVMDCNRIVIAGRFARSARRWIFIGWRGSSIRW